MGGGTSGAAGSVAKSVFVYDGASVSLSIVAIVVLTWIESTAPAGFAQSCASGQSEDGRGAGTEDDECWAAPPWWLVAGIAISQPGCVASDSCRQIAAAASGRSCKSSKRVATDRTMTQQ